MIHPTSLYDAQTRKCWLLDSMKLEWIFWNSWSQSLSKSLTAAWHNGQTDNASIFYFWTVNFWLRQPRPFNDHPLWRGLSMSLSPPFPTIINIAILPFLFRCLCSRVDLYVECFVVIRNCENYYSFIFLFPWLKLLVKLSIARLDNLMSILST